MSKPLVLTVAAVSLITLVSAFAIPMGGAGVGGGTDYSALPPAAPDAFKKIKGMKMNLADAIQAAQGDNGTAHSATMNFNATPPTIQVLTYTETTAVKTTIDASTGTVLSKADVPRFPGQPVTGEPTTTPSGLMYFDLQVGEGAAPEGAGAQVTVHYSGWLTDGSPFDSSVERGQPITFPLSGVIAGWTEGVGSMKVGGKRKLIIPYQLAYGEMGRPPVIPGKATLIFDVELIAIPAGEDHTGHNH